MALDSSLSEEAAGARRPPSEATRPCTFAGIETRVLATAINCARFKYVHRSRVHIVPDETK